MICAWGCMCLCEGELRGAGPCLSSIPPVTTATPLREGKWVYGRAETCEVWTWRGRETTTEGREEGDEEDDRWQARMGERKVQREGGHWGARERERERDGERWQVIVAVGVTGSRRKTEESMRESIDIPHKTVSSHLKGSLCLLLSLSPLHIVADSGRCKCWPKMEN